MRGIFAAVLLLSLAGTASAEPSAANMEKELQAFLEAFRAAKDKPAAKPGGTAVVVRLPTWEISAVLGAEALAGPGMRLTDPELAAAREVFEESVDLDAVRVVSDEAPVTCCPRVSGNVIRVPGGYVFKLADVIHELTHVWQYQTRGLGYISDSFLHQACAFLGTGKRDGAYVYKIVAGQKLSDYAAEQQAQIVEDYYAHEGLRANADYKALIAQLRASKAVKQGAAVFLDQAAGIPPRGKEPPPLPGWEAPREGAGVPQLEIRF